jgi:hypothetical protein
VVASAPAGTLVSQLEPAVKIMEEIEAKRLYNPEPGVWIFDMVCICSLDYLNGEQLQGENFAGWVRMKVRNGVPGQRIRLRFGELLWANG